MPDLDLDSLRRSIDLTQYARSLGYEERPRDAVPGITVLEHERLGDRIAVARLSSGGIYARIADYAARGEGEPEELARGRLRDCITRSKDTGTIVEFVRNRERRAGRPEPDAERIREELATWQQLARALPHALEDPRANALHRRIGDWRPSPPSHEPPVASEVQARLRRWHDAQNALLDRHFTRRDVEVAPAGPPAPSRARDRGASSELALRRYDWSPTPPTHPANPVARTARGRGGPERDR